MEVVVEGMEVVVVVMESAAAANSRFVFLFWPSHLKCFKCLCHKCNKFRVLLSKEKVLCPFVKIEKKYCIYA